MLSTLRAAKLGLPKVLLEIWETLLTIVRGQYDNMSGSPENIHKRRMKLLRLWRKVSLFVVKSNISMKLSYSMDPSLI